MGIVILVLWFEMDFKGAASKEVGKAGSRFDASAVVR